MLNLWKRLTAGLMVIMLTASSVPLPVWAESFVTAEKTAAAPVRERTAAATGSNASAGTGAAGKVAEATADNAEISEDAPDGEVIDDLAVELPEVITETIAAAASQIPAAAEDIEFETPEMIQASLEDEDLPDNDEMLEGYLEHLTAMEKPKAMEDPAIFPRANSSLRNQSGYPSGSMEDIIYCKLLSEVQKIAAGKRTDTKIVISWTDLGVPVDTRIYFSDIGYDEAAGRTDIWECLASTYGFSISLGEMQNIVRRLLYYVPYELYWYEKTTGYSYGWNGRLGGSYDMEAGDYYVTGLSKDTGIVVLMSVAQEFQGAQYSADAKKTGAASAAVSTAAGIVDQYAGYPDERILREYVKEICALTSYNYDAAAGSPAASGNNPWQLIWVFDGDAGTKVVCEGYAKAFNYLCDLTDFRGDVDCVLVSGMMGNPCGEHMWNTVKIDGKNYLVDVTNMDGSGFGAPDRLFLRGGKNTGPSSWEYSDGTVVSSPTYYFEGVRYYYDPHTLQACDDYLFLSEMNYDPSQEPVIPVTGVKLSASEKIMAPGKTFQLTARLQPSTATNRHVTWSSSAPSVAAVSAAGLVTAGKTGTATITVKTADGGKTAKCRIRVADPVTGITVSPAAETLETGDSFQLTASVQPASTVQTVTWSSSDPSVASVSSTGLVTAVKSGTATITAKAWDGRHSASCVVTVPVHVNGVRINTGARTIIPGKTFQLVAWPQPSNATNKAVTWSSSNTAVAAVNSKGLVTAVKQGTAEITVKTADGGYTAVCKITVGIPVTGVKINTGARTIIPGKTFQLVAWPQPSNASNKGVTWSSSDPSVAEVSSTGLVTAVKAGTATVTVKTADGGYKAVCKITAGIPVTGVKINTTAKTMAPGKTFQLVAWPQPSNAANKAVTWSSSNTAVATVNSKGLVTAVKAGTATVTVKTADGGYKAVCKITVNVPVTGVKINTTARTIAVGKTFQLVAWPQPANAVNKNVTWSSSNKAVAAVSSTGLVKAVKKGTAVITVKTADGGYTAVCRITVQ